MSVWYKHENDKVTFVNDETNYNLYSLPDEHGNFEIINDDHFQKNGWTKCKEPSKWKKELTFENVMIIIISIFLGIKIGLWIYYNLI